ncbi:MAG: DUF1499 domain-containing protein [Burkholderiaceae bacterium]
MLRNLPLAPAALASSIAGGVVRMRSASRIGRSDFSVNRARMERIRDAMNGGRRIGKH